VKFAHKTKNLIANHIISGSKPNSGSGLRLPYVSMALPGLFPAIRIDGGQADVVSSPPAGMK
jgi:hypothetical protein